jgi:hypothetical protein
MGEKVKNAKKRMIHDIDEELDIAYVGFPTNEHTVGIEIDEDIVAHMDVDKKKIIGFTITHLERFRKKMYLKERAKESVKEINEYILKNFPCIKIPTSLFTSISDSI